MKVLLIGGGGREHALAWKITQSPLLSQLYVAPGSSAIGLLPRTQCLELPDIEATCQFSTQNTLDLVVIGPEAPLEAGLSDALRQVGVLVFGPSQQAAQLECSKAFAKQGMQRWGVPTAQGRAFTQFAPASQYLQSLSPPYVLKMDGLAGGKGVFIHEDFAAAQTQLKSLLPPAAASSMPKVLIETFMPGEEASLFALCHGDAFVLSPAIQDHKRLLDGDQGPNTGGMGAYGPAPIVSHAVRQAVIEHILRPTLQGMVREGMPYSGVLYLGLMVHQQTAKVVEFNVRFGDPECQPLMLLLQSDLLPLLHGIAQGRVPASHTVKWASKSAACVVLASQGYPATYPTGQPIWGLDAQGQLPPSPFQANRAGMVFHAGSAPTTQANPNQTSHWQTAGGRVLGVCACEDTLEQALHCAYEASAQIRWHGVHYRRDVGVKAHRIVDTHEPTRPPLIHQSQPQE